MSYSLQRERDREEADRYYREQRADALAARLEVCLSCDGTGWVPVGVDLLFECPDCQGDPCD